MRIISPVDIDLRSKTIMYNNKTKNISQDILGHHRDIHTDLTVKLNHRDNLTLWWNFKN